MCLYFMWSATENMAKKIILFVKKDAKCKKENSVVLSFSFNSHSEGKYIILLCVSDIQNLRYFINEPYHQPDQFINQPLVSGFVTFVLLLFDILVF